MGGEGHVAGLVDLRQHDHLDRRARGLDHRHEVAVAVGGVDRVDAHRHASRRPRRRRPRRQPRRASRRPWRPAATESSRSRITSSAPTPAALASIRGLEPGMTWQLRRARWGRATGSAVQVTCRSGASIPKMPRTILARDLLRRCARARAMSPHLVGEMPRLGVTACVPAVRRPAAVSAASRGRSRARGGAGAVRISSARAVSPSTRAASSSAALSRSRRADVLGADGRRGDRRGALLGRERGHARGRRVEAGGRDRRRHAARVQHRDGRLADAERLERLGQVVVRRRREGLDGRLQGLGVLRGERAHGVLHPVAELGEHHVGQVGGELGDEEHADALRADQADRLGHRVEEGVGGAVEQQVGLVEEEDQGRLLGVADLGEALEQLGQHPHQEGREERRLARDVDQVQHRDDPAPVGRRPQQVGHLEGGLAEEDVAAVGLELGDLAQQHAGRGAGDAAERLQLGLAVRR